MNTKYLMLVLLKCWFLGEFVIESVAVSEVKFDVRSLNRNKAYARSFHLKERSYLYLNYKEAYGLRFDPKKIQKKALSNDTDDSDSSWNTVPTESVDITTTPTTKTTTMSVDDTQTIPTSPETNPIDTTTIAIPTSSDRPVVTTNATVDDIPSSTASTRPKILSFTTLRNRINASKQPNATVIQQPQKQSALKETLKLIRKRIKQWLSLGTDPQASVLNGQRFLNVFNVIKFENSPCTSTQEGLTEMSGICYHDYQCTQMGGSSIDECADGLGVCCVCK